jgi:signal transduction histidine kinase
MKTFWVALILALCFGNFCFAQSQSDDTIIIKNIPSDGILLDKGWKFYPGDDSNYRFNTDRGENGVPLNPGLDLDKLPEVKNAGIGWFLLNLKVDSTWRNKEVGITLSMLGAAEFFLNGESIAQFGIVSTNYKDEKTQGVFKTAFNFRLGNNENQLLAVRFSYNKNNLYLKPGTIPYCLWTKLYPANENFNQFARFVKQTFIFTGLGLTINLAAAFLTLFFFFAFPYRKEYLYFGLYFTFGFIATAVQSFVARVAEPLKPSANGYLIMMSSSVLLYMVGSFWYLNGMYDLLKIKRTRFYWIIIVYAILAIMAFPFLPVWGGLLPVLFIPLTCLETVPTYYRAVKARFRGALILFLSCLMCTISLFALIIEVFQSDHEKVVALHALSILTPAMGLIIFLAGDFARISLSLQSRIVDVEELSRKTIAQEKEKQEILAEQKDKLEKEVQDRTSELRKSFSDLKAAQTQLIQSEKMASLGELTAGIAHEIQNPLNFVNNFSELNEELIDEMDKAMEENNLEAARNISKSVKQNLEKTVQHGKRADAIVKGMLQHSRTGSGQKEATDINALANEFLWLSYKGLRTKDPHFSASIETEYDEQIGSINVISQDMGRVLVNLYNNAFYALREKEQKSLNGYKPSVIVSTKKENGMVEILVKDNGIGIPENMHQKIFQPFFTTKPTGQGTGLGLSLSYDIVKAHGGEIRVSSEIDKGSEFTVTLPIV